MTHWLRSALRRIKERSAQPVPATVRGGPSRKMSGVSTVEYALILVAVVGIVAGGAVMLGGDFQQLFTDLGDEIGRAEAIGQAAEDEMTQ